MIVCNGADAKNSLGSRIRSARQERGWSLEKLAREVEVSKVSVWSWEQDRTKPRRGAMERLSAMLGIESQTQTTALNAGTIPPVVELISNYQRRIAKDLGVEADAVEIRITFSRAAA